jgi:hypothetical protein
MNKPIDFSKGIRGKHAKMHLEIIGAVENAWAVCVTKNDADLIPFKLYNVEKRIDKDEIKVKNERGETVICPKIWFAVIDISPNVVGLLESVR